MSDLPSLDLKYTHFLNKTTLALGVSGTGKSFITIDIMYLLRPYVRQVIVFSPTDQQNHTYDRGLVPLPCIHYTITPAILGRIWERQEAFIAVSLKANRIEILKKLFDRLKINDRVRGEVAAIDKKMDQIISDLQSSGLSPAILAAKIKELRDEKDKWKVIIFKHYINEHRDELIQIQSRLSADEQFSLANMNINPNILLIFDDCTDLLAKLVNDSVMKKIFFQGRHTGISAIFNAHTDKALSAELRKSAFVTIFTEEKSAFAYFDRKTNDFTKEEKNRAIAALKVAFTPVLAHQKLIWIRQEGKFYKFTATPREEFTFGSSHIWSFCEKIQSSPGTISANNRFMSAFLK